MIRNVVTNKMFMLQGKINSVLHIIYSKVNNCLNKFLVQYDKLKNIFGSCKGHRQNDDKSFSKLLLLK